MAAANLEVTLDLKVPMRDGVLLSADLYRPRSSGPLPALLCRTIYDNQQQQYVDWAVRFATAGYAVVLQDCRGRYDSDGTWNPYLCEIPDGYDTQQWVGEQSWCDGRIGTFGISYPGFTQILPAPLRSPYVKALVPIANQEDNFGLLYSYGALQLETAMLFGWMGHRTCQATSWPLLDRAEVFRRLPLVSALDGVTDRPIYRHFVRHSTFDAYWQSYSMKKRYEDVDVPAFFITGWYDNLLHEVFKTFRGWKKRAGSAEARARTKLLVGPWTHVQIGSAAKFGDVEFGPDAEVDIPGVHLRWYDRRLKGVENGLDGEAPIRIFVMGANLWRNEWEWPLPRTRYEPWYLHGGGVLSTAPPGDEPPDSFTYDPKHPVPTFGGQSLFPESSGPRDRRPVEERDDVLVYTSGPLAEDVEVTGPVVLELYAASSAVDTDFTATLVDVHPTGEAILVVEGILRASFRDSFETPVPIEPGRIYRYAISLWETSNVFRSGHRIRLEISSSNFPRFNRNLNTGEELATATRIDVARQTVLHDTAHPSHLLLPEIPS